MAAREDVGTVHWHRSFYVRIAGSLVLFFLCLLVFQSLVFNRARTRSPLGSRPPNTVVAIVAADLESALAQNRSSDPDAYLKREYARSQPIYFIVKDGPIASNRTAPLADDISRYVSSLLQSGAHGPALEPNVPIPFVTAPVQVGGALHGIVVLPPAPGPSPLARELERLASVPGTVIFVVLAIVAAAFIFEPARRRLKALEAASQRLGAGDLTARAPVTGGDEVAAVASAFNRMADELASRDEALRTADRARRQMLADVSHELKTPLTSMRGYVETLRRADVTLDPHTRYRYFDTLERETMRLERLIKDLLDLSRLENGVADLDRRVFATARLFEHVRSRHLPEIERRQISVRVDIAPAVDQIVADPDRLEQVIENLFANALRHTPDASDITLAAWSNGEKTVLTVTDLGAGIPAEHLAHVFDRFYKVDAARTRRSEGSGLGLSIAKAIVERHGGTLEVTSEPGHTTFSVALPRDPAVDGTVHSASTNL